MHYQARRTGGQPAQVGGGFGMGRSVQAGADQAHPQRRAQSQHGKQAQAHAQQAWRQAGQPGLLALWVALLIEGQGGRCEQAGGQGHAQRLWQKHRHQKPITATACAPGRYQQPFAGKTGHQPGEGRHGQPEGAAEHQWNRVNRPLPPTL